MSHSTTVKIATYCNSTVLEFHTGSRRAAALFDIGVNVTKKYVNYEAQDVLVQLSNEGMIGDGNKLLVAAMLRMTDEDVREACKVYMPEYDGDEDYLYKEQVRASTWDGYSALCVEITHND